MKPRDYQELEKLPALYATDGMKGDLPAVKLFTPWANATWILWEYDPEQQTGFGLCDLGLGFPEMGYVSLEEVAELTGPGGIGVERELYTHTRFDGYRAAGVDIPDYLVA